jgi:hypothetical protein|tara:strand:+ start:15 stop:182 length:168 start_codon:yes stop_codon:yes gene_type:complete
MLAYTKALGAVITGTLAIINQTIGLGLDIDPDKINALLISITPFLVWLLPNFPKE